MTQYEERLCAAGIQIDRADQARAALDRQTSPGEPGGVRVVDPGQLGSLHSRARASAVVDASCKPTGGAES